MSSHAALTATQWGRSALSVAPGGMPVSCFSLLSSGNGTGMPIASHDSHDRFRHSLTRRVVLLFLVPALGALAALAIFAAVLQRTADADLLIDRAGRLRVQSEHLVSVLDRSLHSHAAFRARDLSETAGDFGRQLALLRDGGTERGKSLPPVPESVRGALNGLLNIWAEQQRQINIVLSARADPRAREAAHEYLDRHVLDLLVGASAVVDASREYRQGLMRHMLALLAMVVALDIAALVAALLMLRRFRQTSDHAESALRESEARFRGMIESMNDWTWETDEDGRYTYASPHIRNLLGYEPDEMLGRRPVEFMTPEDAARLDELFGNTVRNSLPFFRIENWNLHREGHEVLLESSGVPILDEHGVFRGYRGIDRDITREKRAQRALTENEEMLRELMENIREVFFVRDIAQNRIVYVSPAFEALWGISRAALYADRRVFLRPIHPDDRERVLAALSVQDAGGPLFNEEYRIFTPTGEMRWMWARTFPVRDSAGRMYRTAGLVEDVTDRKADLRMLRNQITRNETILRTTRDGFFVLGEDLRILEANEALCRMLGCDRQQILHRRIVSIESRDDANPGEKYQQMFRETGGRLFEARYYHSDGRLIPVEVSLSHAALGGDNLVFAFVRDISERRRVEAERLRHEKKQRDALVREVHHRIKNNLQGVVGLLRQQAVEQPALATLLENAIVQVNTVAVVHGLQGQAGGGELRFADVAGAVTRAVTGIMGVTVSLDAEPDSGLIRLHPEESVPVALILNELVVNAVKHRRPGNGGEVRVEIRCENGLARARIAGTGKSLPAGFDFSAGRGLGTGLTLVRALLPPGASLTFKDSDGKTVVDLWLQAPVVELPGMPDNPATGCSMH